MDLNKKSHRSLLARKVLCPKCLSRQRRAPNKVERKILTQHQVVSAMYAYLMSSWEALPEKNKRALGFDTAVGSKGEEEGFNHLAKLFMDYADLSFQWSLAARRRRLNIDDKLPEARLSLFESIILAKDALKGPDDLT